MLDLKEYVMALSNILELKQIPTLHFGDLKNPNLYGMVDITEVQAGLPMIHLQDTESYNKAHILSNGTSIDLLETIAHECIHIQQMHKGFLDWNGRNVVWLGQTISAMERHMLGNNAPWEVEAYGKEKELKEQALLSLGLSPQLNWYEQQRIA